MVRCEILVLSASLVLSYSITCNLLFQYLFPSSSPMNTTIDDRFRWLEVTHDAVGGGQNLNLRDRLKTTLRNFTKFINANESVWSTDHYRHQYLSFLLRLEIYSMATGHHLVFPANTSDDIEARNCELMYDLTSSWLDPAFSELVESMITLAIRDTTFMFLPLLLDGATFEAAFNTIAGYLFDRLHWIAQERKFPPVSYGRPTLVADKAYFRKDDLMQGLVDDEQLGQWLSNTYIQRVLIHWPFREIATITPNEDIKMNMIRSHVIASSVFRMSLRDVGYAEQMHIIYRSVLAEAVENFTVESYPIEIFTKFTDKLEEKMGTVEEMRLKHMWKAVLSDKELEVEYKLVDLKVDVWLALFFIIDALLTQLTLSVGGWTYA